MRLIYIFCQPYLQLKNSTLDASSADNPTPLEFNLGTNINSGKITYLK